MAVLTDKAPMNLGSFEDEVVAAKAYDRAASEAYGAYALLNLPEG